MTRRVVWFQDLDFHKFSGGAESTDRLHFQEGLRRGYDMAIVTPENQTQAQLTPDDLIVYSNIRRFDPEQLASVKCPYVVFHHDTWCRYRLFYPRIPSKCLVRCPVKQQWTKLFEKARLHVFLSPLHYQIHREVFGSIIEPHVEVPSPMPPGGFVNMNLERDGYCNISGLHPFKGRDNLLKWAQENPDKRLSILGENPDRTKLPQNVKLLPPVPPGRMVYFYNAFEYFIHLPNHVDPFCRSLAESYLSGCKIIGNANIGCLSWPFFTNGRDTVEKELLASPQAFWAAIEKYVF